MISGNLLLSVPLSRFNISWKYFENIVWGIKYGLDFIWHFKIFVFSTFFYTKTLHLINTL